MSRQRLHHEEGPSAILISPSPPFWVIKRVFRLTLRAAQGFIDSIFALMNVPLRCPDYTSVSKRAKSVNVSFKTSTRGEIAHLVIDSTGLKVFGEGEWKVRKHGKERRRIWRKLHLAVDSNTHEIVCADLSLNNVTDSEAFPGLIRQTHRKIRGSRGRRGLRYPALSGVVCGRGAESYAKALASDILR